MKNLQMKTVDSYSVLSFTAQLSSLYSIRIPYTWQSSLTYPLPPPSAVRGLYASALQRLEDIAPDRCLSEVEENVHTVWVRPLSPIAMRSHTVSTVTKFRAVEKKKQTPQQTKITDALPRQFAFCHSMEIAGLLMSSMFADRLAEALENSPIVLGDSESVASVVKLTRATTSYCSKGEMSTRFYFPLKLIETSKPLRTGTIYWVHTSCKGARDLTEYVFPLAQENNILVPRTLELRLRPSAKAVTLGEDNLPFLEE